MGSDEIPTVTYFLVLLRAGPDRDTAAPPWSAHVALIESGLFAPYVVLHRYYVPEVVEWRLVGVAPGAIDPVLTLPK